MLLSASGLTAIATAIALLHRIDAIDAYRKQPLSLNLFEEADDADDLVGAVSSAWLLLIVATSVVFVIWQWRCAKNAEVLGRANPRYRPGWSIGGWFIPLANFVIPIQIIQGFWRATTPGTHPGIEWRRHRGSALLGWWWAIFLVGNVTSRLSVSDRNTFDEIRTDDTTMAVGSLISAVAAVLAIAVVVQLTRRFNARRAEALPQ